MKAKIVIGLDGSIGIVTEQGTFEAGSAKVEALLKALNLDGLDIRLDKPMEQHRHDEPDKLHAHGGQVHSH